ncbi:hypothetical protein ABZ656_39705 [Streptomyces sp. NPDC007095]|jgi:hypothetical protein|uniref:hypothetical protein n=1 Tax=Streptomyces sp. NPDC007095 TaxID=3154482 RepID=UPI000CC9D1F9
MTLKIESIEPVTLYRAALGAGMMLVLFGHASPVEATGCVAPFLVIFERTHRDGWG